MPDNEGQAKPHDIRAYRTPLTERVLHGGKADAAALLGGDCWSFHELGRQVAWRQDWMRRTLPAPSKVWLALWLGTGAEFVAMLLAGMRHSENVLLLDPELSQDEARSLCRRAGCGHVVVSRAPLHGAPVAEFQTHVLPKRGGRGEATHERENASGVLVFHTSGSTGGAKIVWRTQEQLSAEMEGIQKQIGFASHDRVLTMVPCHHAYGLMVGLLTPLAFGSAVRLVSRATAGSVEKLAVGDRSTILVGTAFQYKLLCARAAANREALALCRLLLTSGSPTPRWLWDRVREVYGKRLNIAYGSTETGSLCMDVQTDPAAPFAGVGVPNPGIELRVHPSGQDAGPVEVRGEQIFGGYLDAPADCLGPGEHGWWRSQDLGLLTGGRLFLQGRRGGPLNIAGEKIDPDQIVRTLCTFPGVSDARILLHHSPLGEGILLAALEVGGHVDVSALRRHCALYLAPRKRPKLFKVLQAFPRSATGKVNLEQLQRICGVGANSPVLS